MIRRVGMSVATLVGFYVWMEHRIRGTYDTAAVSFDSEYGGTDEGYLLEHNDTQVLKNVHSADRCAGDTCTIHNRSDHHMRAWPQHWRQDRGIMERICVHGVGHPDPDDWSKGATHGCDGCCAFSLHEMQVYWDNVDVEVPGFIQVYDERGLILNQLVTLTDGMDHEMDQIGEIISMRLSPEGDGGVIYGVRFQP